MISASLTSQSRSLVFTSLAGNALITRSRGRKLGARLAAAGAGAAGRLPHTRVLGRAARFQPLVLVSLSRLGEGADGSVLGIGWVARWASQQQGLFRLCLGPGLGNELSCFPT